MIFWVNEESKNENEKNGRERVRVSLFLVTGYFLESVTEWTSDFEEFTIFTTNAYQKKIEREREKRADLVESWEFRDWEMWKLFDDASAGFVEGKRFDSLSFFCFFLLLFSFFFSLFWFGYLNKLYVDTAFERERELITDTQVRTTDKFEELRVARLSLVGLA